MFVNVQILWASGYIISTIDDYHGVKTGRSGGMIRHYINESAKIFIREKDRHGGNRYQAKGSARVRRS